MTLVPPSRRFAWSIFPSLSGFLLDGSTTRSVTTVEKDGGRTTRKVEEKDADALQERAKPRSRSPTKRLRAAFDIPEPRDSVHSTRKRRVDDGENTTYKRQRTTRTASDDLTLSNSSESPPPQRELTSSQSVVESPLPSLEEDDGLAAEEVVRRSTSLLLPEDYDQLKAQYLNRQRPAGLKACTGTSIFEGAKDVHEILERAGVEIRDDSSADPEEPC